MSLSTVMSIEAHCLPAPANDEISRLARKEIRAEVEPLRRSNAILRSDIASLKKLVRHCKLTEASPQNCETTADRRACTCRTERSDIAQAKRGISAADYGALVGVSSLSIYKCADDKVRLLWRPHGKSRRVQRHRLEYG